MAETGLDLVEVAATARPRWSASWTTEVQVRDGEAARLREEEQHVIELKEVKYRPGIDDHDFARKKARHARRFLEEKNKVKVTMMFPRRQVAHRSSGKRCSKRVATALSGHQQIERRDGSRASR